jgi:hypothetical protein
VRTTSHRDEPLRRWLRGEHVVDFKVGGEWEPDKDAIFVRALAGAPRYHGPLYRGTEMGDDSLRRLADRGSVVQTGSRSWTTCYAFAVDWAERHARGHRAVVLFLDESRTARDLRGLNPIQSEVVVPAGARFKVVSIRDQNEHVLVHLKQTGRRR